mmetsp:Transcript_19374/g.51718  ORF Transcript_19374/g.51718 Transcript_19374/m.51718 type:complete len:224 (+) Transcript_19374:790-1461(+)
MVGEEGECVVEPSSVTFALPSILNVYFSDCVHGETGALQEPGVPWSRRREGDNDGFPSLGDSEGVAGDISPLLMVGDASPFTECPVLRRARPMGRGAGLTNEFTEGATGRAPERTGVNNWSLVLPPSNGSMTPNMSCRLANSATPRDMFLSPDHHCTAWAIASEYALLCFSIDQCLVHCAKRDSCTLANKMLSPAAPLKLIRPELAWRSMRIRRKIFASGRAS